MFNKRQPLANAHPFSVLELRMVVETRVSGTCVDAEKVLERTLVSLELEGHIVRLSMNDSSQ